MARTGLRDRCFVVAFWVATSLIVNQFSVSPCASCHLFRLAGASSAGENATIGASAAPSHDGYESESSALVKGEQVEEMKQLNSNEPASDGVEAAPTISPLSSTFDADDDAQTKEVKAFRVEYTKYRILSQLGITVDPTDFRATIDPELKSQLISMELDSEARLNRGKKQRPDRRKRALPCHHVKAEKNVCCLERLFINFTEIGWDKWILHPDGYNANFCRGGCDLSHFRYYHTTLLSKLSPKIEVCCSPSSTSPLTMLYLDDDKRVQRKILPDMIAESCDCA